MQVYIPNSQPILIWIDWFLFSASLCAGNQTWQWESINWQLSIAIGPSYIKLSGGISLSHFCWPCDQPNSVNKSLSKPQPLSTSSDRSCRCTKNKDSMRPISNTHWKQTHKPQLAFPYFFHCWLHWHKPSNQLGQLLSLLPCVWAWLQFLAQSIWFIWWV